MRVKIEDELSFSASLAYNLNQHPLELPWVAALEAANIADFIKSCETSRMKLSRQGEVHAQISFVYTSQGAKWYTMKRELIDLYPLFKDCLLEPDGYLKEFCATWS